MGKHATSRKSSKVSLIKHSNKRYSKLLKQGKIKKNNRKLNKGAYGIFPKHLTQNTVISHENSDPVINDNCADVSDMLEDDDDDVIRNSSFAQESRKRTLAKTETLSTYEKTPRKFDLFKNAKKVKTLLPLKGKSGVIPQYMEVEDDASVVSDDCKDENVKICDDQSNDVGIENAVAATMPTIDPVKLSLLKSNKISACKLKIVHLASSIIENPQGNLKSLKELRLMLDDKDPVAYNIRQKLVMVSLVEVFKDIIPGYRIRDHAEKDPDTKLKKVTKELREFEEGLLRNYKSYLQHLEAATQVLSPKRKTSGSAKKTLLTRCSEKLGEVAIKCLCELLITHPHFNFRNNIIVTLVPYTNSPNQNVSELCFVALKTLYRQDKLGEATVEAVKQTTKLVKEKSYNVLPKVLETFLYLKIKDAKLEGANENQAKKVTHREKLMTMSRRELKKSKQMAKLEKEMLETAAEESKQTKIKFHTETIKQVFLTYFRILKKAPKSTLLSLVLEGLAKYAHLINVEFFDDLILILNQLIESETLDYRQCLHCIETVFTILSGQGEALNIDPYRFYTHLYRNLFALHIGSSNVDVPIAVECLDLMINHRRKKVSYHRVLAFTKRLCTLALQLYHNGAITMLALVRTFLQNHKRVDVLLDTDTSQGSGVFLPELEEPEYCNAITTAVWELHLMKSHYHPVVQKFSHHIALGVPITGEGQLASDLSRRSPEELYDEYSTEGSDFNPPLPERSIKVMSKTKAKIKQKHWKPVSAEFYHQVTMTMEQVDLEGCVFNFFFK